MPVVEREDCLELAGDLSRCRQIRTAELQRPGFLTPAGCESNHSNQQAHNSDFLSVHGVLQSVPSPRYPKEAQADIKPHSPFETKSQVTLNH
jgi:hypothetical protein